MAKKETVCDILKKELSKVNLDYVMKNVPSNIVESVQSCQEFVENQYSLQKRLGYNLLLIGKSMGGAKTNQLYKKLYKEK
jgi:hypothetical protein